MAPTFEAVVANLKNELMSTKMKGFFGYSSNPTSAGESVEAAVKSINEENRPVID